MDGLYNMTICFSSPGLTLAINAKANASFETEQKFEQNPIFSSLPFLPASPQAKKILLLLEWKRLNLCENPAFNTVNPYKAPGFLCNDLCVVICISPLFGEIFSSFPPSLLFHPFGLHRKISILYGSWRCKKPTPCCSTDCAICRQHQFFRSFFISHYSHGIAQHPIQHLPQWSCRQAPRLSKNNSNTLGVLTPLFTLPAIINQSINKG